MVKRAIKILAVAALMAVILVAIMSPAMARRASGGQPMPTTKPCYATANAQNEDGSHFELRPESEIALCWKVFPDGDE
jgi:hypothetical protein